MSPKADRKLAASTGGLQASPETRTEILGVPLKALTVIFRVISKTNQ